MTLNDLINQFMTILNRKDCTTDLANIFVMQSVQRIERTLRVPSMERASVVWAGVVPMPSFDIPNDLLQVIDVYANERPLQRVSFAQLQQMRRGVCGPGCPRYYARVGSSVFLHPWLDVGGNVTLIYYGTFTALTDGNSWNEATSAFPDAIIYGALGFAGDYFKCDNAAQWQQTFAGLIADIQDQASQLDNTGGASSVQPLHMEDHW